jgi:transaldolase/glucose-6-phosphate isomerase
MANPISEVRKFGQSLWYDFIRRGLITSGELRNMVEEDGLLGVTSNPSIFEKAVTGSDDYDQAIKALVEQEAGGAKEIYERLAIEDIQLAADVLYAAYVRGGGRDGFVSLEVSPYLADDTQGTIDEALRLKAAVGRENVLIKVPATPAGFPAIRELISRGVSVNVTLLFSIAEYLKAADAYMSGLQALAEKGGALDKVASVASFFLSRIDTLVDDRAGRRLDQERDGQRRALLKSLVGKVAIASAKVAYAHYRELIESPRWQALAAKGATPQRLLWASTSTKNPKYPKTMYVDALIGPDTVNTLPAETYNEFKAHGRPRPSLTENWAESLEQAQHVLQSVDAFGLSLKQVTDELRADGVKKFCDAFDQLLAAVEKKRQALLGDHFDRQTYALGSAEQAVKDVLEDWRAGGKVRRLWQKDATLWTGRDEHEWLGWMHVVEGQREHNESFTRLAEDVKQAGFKHALLLGMGGSSLCPDVMRRTFARVDGFPQLRVLDSTVPAQVTALERQLDPAATLFIVSSKSGTTTEPNVFKQYFYERVVKAVGADEAGARFAAITDPGTPLHQLAKRERFRHIFFGLPSIGGRYSALSNFGMAPAAAMGLSVAKFLDNAEIMLHACASCVPADKNPGVALGAVLGALARQGRDKVTLIASPSIASLGAWLEQLLAESTGKQGKGLVPVDDEELGPPEAYGDDRLFVCTAVSSATSPAQDAAVAALERAGHPVVRIMLKDTLDLGQEFLRWEFATAVAGSILGINAFNQPDVEASKVATRKLTAAYEKSGALPAETPMLKEGGLSLFADEQNGAALRSAAKKRDVAGFIAAHLGRLGRGDYFAINAYVQMDDDTRRELQAMRLAVRDARRVATTLGYGPRFLHSTGQLHKGGPNTGVFLQITSDDAQDLPIAGQKYTFGVLKRAQAEGDFQVLAERGRRLLRVHLGADVGAGLKLLREVVAQAVKS